MTIASWKQSLSMAQQEAMLAVSLYNDPNLPRSFEGFVIHMHLAWLYLLQAEFKKSKTDFRIPDPKLKNRYIKVDGEYKSLDLQAMVKKRWAGQAQDPVVANIEFFIKLRNKIEHRHRVIDEAVMREVMGQSHALLLNFEEELSAEFGAAYSLAYKLRFPVFIGTFTTSSQETIRRLRGKIPEGLGEFIAEYESQLDEDILASEKYSIRLTVKLDRARSNPDLVLTFINESDELFPAVEEGSAGSARATVIRSVKRQAVINLNEMKPGVVVAKVQDGIPFQFSMHLLQKAMIYFDIKAGKTAPDPSVTKEDYCLWDAAHKDYVYKQNFVDLLIRELATPARFEQITGKPPIAKL